MNCIVVTGGCGFIGSNFIRLMLEQYPELSIINIDKLTYAGNLANLHDLNENSQYEFRKGDICDREFIESILNQSGIDAVVNFAAESHVDRSILDSTPFVTTNVNGTLTLLDACRTHEIPRYLQVSTDEVYGSLGDEGFFTEETSLAPNSPYSASKASADMLVRSYVHTFDFPAVITRCSNNYGPYQFPEKLLPLFISNARNDQQLPVYGTGENVRDWIHVLDHCRGIDAALRNGSVGEVYNFGGRTEMTNIALTKLLLKLLDKPESLIKYVNDRPGHDQRYAIDCEKAEIELGWSPQVRFKEGLQATIDWYIKNEDWVNNIRSGDYLKYYDQQYSDRLSGS
ncbi:dTDP-glucose 4,6-dehydratase [bacterium]|jgi:dTDP-glucose 4,6-dehydratase|nr:dTDP-glucose 4,6-dehydratase [Planctomicrobium sp.]MDB4439323.1 dTDP-glucose 4,6-dehydratase [Planctomicrobium sp.]MDB4802339.1 dTDP-glucose 4,6-dehydratase [bacterium]